jgi:hypothetical protein
VQTFEVDETVLVADVLAARAFRPWARLAMRVGPSGSRRRAVAMAGFAAWLPVTVILAMPTLALARFVLRPVVRSAARSQVGRIAPAAGVPRGPVVHA